MKQLFISTLFVLACISSIFCQDITLIFPYDDEVLTDFACSWKAKITTDGPYELQLSQEENFSSYITRGPQGSKYNENEVKDDRDIVYFLSSQGTLVPDERWILEPGDWYWRITADKGNSVSEIRKLTVTNDVPAKSVGREISPQKPLFHLRFRRPTNNPASDVSNIIPDEFKDIMVLNIGLLYDFLHNGESDLYKYAKKFNDTGYKFAIDFGYPSNTAIRVSLGEIEKIYRDLPNFVGGEMTEMFYNNRETDIDNSHIHGALKLSRKYGKYMFHADMNWKYNKLLPFNYEMYDVIKDNYSDYYIPALKATEPFGTYTVISTIQGMKLAGMAKNIGMWSDMWSWEKFGPVNTFGIDKFIELTHGTGQQEDFPYMQHIKQYIYAISYGATVFGLEPAKQWDWGPVTPNDLYKRYLMPFIEAVVRENIIPSEKAINENFHVVVDTEIETDNPGSTAPITYMEGNVWGDYLRNTFGIADIDGYDTEKSAVGTTIQRAAYIEISPNTDRYPSGIPFLAKSGIEAPVVNGRTLDVLKISDMTNLANVERDINKYYPESANEAFAIKIDSSIFVFNTNENHDIKQNYSVPIHLAGIDNVHGEINLMSYVLGRIRPDGKTLFIQTNAYKKGGSGNSSDYDYGRYDLPTYSSELNFKCQVEPILESDEISAITKTWDSENGILTLVINHLSAGAVNFTLSGDSNIHYNADSVAIDYQDIDILVHEQVTLNGNVYPKTLQGVQIVWQSLNPSIANISTNGIITGRDEGTCKIVASGGGQSDTLEIKVTKIKVTNFELFTHEVFLDVNDTITLTTIIEPSNASFTTVSWQTGQKYYASVNQNGLVTAKRDKKETFIVATHEASGLSDTCYIYIGDQTNVNHSMEDNIRIYPNPAKDLLFVEGVDANSKFTIVSMSGKLVANTKQLPLNIQELRPGIYILKIESTNKVYFKKVLIRH